jgi:hypothetical protein
MSYYWSDVLWLLVNTVLTLWAGDLRNPVALVAGPKAAGNPIALVVGPKAAGESKCSAASEPPDLPPRRAAGFVFRVLVLQTANFLAPPSPSPGGGSAAGDGPSWVLGGGALVRCTLARFCGGRPRRWCTQSGLPQAPSPRPALLTPPPKAPIPRPPA